MSEKKETIKLTQRWIDNAMDAPSLPTIVDESGKVISPFPLSATAKKSLLELIYNRESGIITRQELLDVLFNPEGTPRGTIIRCRL